jgi:hypothetical protein
VPQPAQERLVAAVVVLDGVEQLIARQLGGSLRARRSSDLNTRISSSSSRFASAFKESR